MGSSLSAISDDIDEYLDRCKRFGVKPQGDSRGYADPYGKHAEALEKREADERKPGLDMASAQRAVASIRLCQFGNGETRDMLTDNLGVKKGRGSSTLKTAVADLAEVEAWLCGGTAPSYAMHGDFFIDRLAWWWINWSHVRHRVAEEDPKVDVVPKIFTKAQAKRRAVEMHLDWVRYIGQLGLVHKPKSEGWFTEPLTGKEGNNVHGLFVLRLEAFKKAGVRPIQ